MILSHEALTLAV